MKNQPFPQRLKFALNGLKLAFRSEKSFKTQTIFCLLSFVLLICIRPTATWWGIFVLANSLVVGAELLNTAIEATLDLVHPEKHQLVVKAKDCAAAAVLVTTLGAIGVFIALIVDTFF